MKTIKARLSGVDLRSDALLLRLSVFLTNHDCSELRIDADMGQVATKVPLREQPERYNLHISDAGGEWKLRAMSVLLQRWEVTWADATGSKSDLYDEDTATIYVADKERVPVGHFRVRVPLVGEGWPGEILAGLAKSLGRAVNVFVLDRERACHLVADLLLAVADSSIGGGNQWTVYPEAGGQSYLCQDGTELATSIIDAQRPGETLADTVARICLPPALGMQAVHHRKAEALRNIASEYQASGALA